LPSLFFSAAFTVYPLPPNVLHYSPTTSQSNSCTCNTIMYSLMSACSLCQGGRWNTWPQFISNCQNTQPPSTFPNPVPSGTRVPQWALLDVTVKSDWDLVKAFDTGDTPEKNPGTLIGSSGSTTSSSSQSPSPPSGGGSLPTGVIVGTIVGGVAVIAIAVLGIIYWQRQHSNVSPATKSVPKLQNEALKLSSDDGTSVLSSMPETPIFKSGIYNQEDSTPFLGYQLAQSALDVSTQQTLTPNNGAANTLANMQMSRPLRYNGLAIV